MEKSKRYLIPVFIFILGAGTEFTFDFINIGSTALANIKENRADILECKLNVEKCRDTHQEILLVLNEISHNDNKFEALLTDLIRKLGHEHTLPDYPAK